MGAHNLLSALLLLSVALVYAGNDHFFQYANVPGWNAYEFGYNRGNHDHFTSRFEKAHGWTFKTKVRWGDKNGWGESYWDYNHNDKGWKKGHDEKKGWGHEHKGWGHGGAGGGGGGGGGQGAFSENVEQAMEPEQPVPRSPVPRNYPRQAPQGPSPIPRQHRPMPQQYRDTMDRDYPSRYQ